MNLINTILGIPLGFLLYLAYQLTNNFGSAVLVFAFFVRLILLPTNIMAHNNSIRFLKLQPALQKLKRQYAGDSERLSEAQYNLFKKEKYSPFLGIVPLLLQLLILFGVLQVMYHPLQHLLHYDSAAIASAISSVRSFQGYHAGAGEQLYVLGALGTIDMSFGGINLGAMPSLRNPSAELWVPMLSGLSAFAFCMIQNMFSPGALSQSKSTNMGLTVFTVVFSVYFAAVTPAGVGIYWTAANVLSIFVVFLLEFIYSPKRLAGDALAQISLAREASQQSPQDKEQRQALKLREKQDAEKWGAARKELVFYALSGGQYKYYKTVIEYILENSDIVIHYLTNDPDDPIFNQSDPCLVPYYASQGKAVSMLLGLDADIMVTTIEDLQLYHMKRSIARQDIEYIHIPHSLGSLNLVSREAAFDHYDTIFCAGPHQIDELRRREELAALPRKRLVKAGYGLYDQLVSQFEAMPKDSSGKPQILIAPSWQDESIFEICIDSMLGSLLKGEWKIVVRPHIQYTNLYPERMEDLMKRYGDYVTSGELAFDMDFSNNSALFSSDLLITDWSGVAFEFSYCTLKPCIFVNTPMKVMNPNYDKYGLSVLNISLRNRVGVAINVDDVSRIDEAVVGLLERQELYRNQIEKVVEHCLFYPGRSGEAGGKYIIDRLRGVPNGGE